MTGPTNLIASAQSSTRIYLSWVDDTDLTKDSVELERSPDGIGSWVMFHTLPRGTERWDDVDLTPETEYFYRVRSLTSPSTYGDYSNTDSSTTHSVLKRITPKLNFYVHSPEAIFKARVNLPGGGTYPFTSIPYDTVTLGSFGDIEPDMTVVIGTVEGGHDLGRTRIRADATSTEILIARSGKGIEDGLVNLQDNAYITVWNDFRVWAKIPFFDLDDAIDYKDGTIAVGDYNTEIPPVSNCGPGFASRVDGALSTSTVQFPRDGVNDSFAMADGATISTYLWDVKDGTITVGTSASAVITATFPPGFRWVSLTVTDSNGKTHTSRCPVLVINEDIDTSIRSWHMSQRLEVKGQTLDIQLFDELDRADYPDGSLVMFWWDEAASPGDRDYIKFIGWLDDEGVSLSRRREGVQKGTTLHCIDVAGRLDKLPGFPQALSRVEDESPWSYMPSLDMNKSLFYLLFWHSTALDLADFYLPADGDDYDAMRLDAGGASLFQQVDSQAQKMVPDHYLTCNVQGQLSVIRDWMLDDVGDRPISSPIITEDLWNNLDYDYNRTPKVHVLRSGAIQSSTAFVDDSLPLVFSVAPGDAGAFSQGVSEVTENEGLALNQTALNKSEGHRYARLNSRFGPFNFIDPTGYNFWNYEPARLLRVQLNISAANAGQRGLDFTTASGQVKSINITYNTSKRGTSIRPSVSWEKETSGFPALTVTPEDVEEVGFVPPPAPDSGLTPDQEMVAGIGLDGFIYRTSDFQTPSGSGGPTWDRVDTAIAEVLYSFVVDPFSPGYIAGSGTIDGWVATEDAIYRLDDLFGTADATVVHTFSTPATASSFHWRTIQASFGEYFAEGSNPWLLCVSYYGNTAGHEGTWALRSLDGGVTWEDEVQVSAFYDFPYERFNPVAVFTSPRTPGLAYTAAYADPDGNGVLPRWGIWPDGGSLTVLEPRISASIQTAQTGTGEDETNLLIAPHPDTKRLDLRIDWVYTRSTPGAGGSTSTLTRTKPSNVSMTGGSNFSNANPNSTASGSFTNTHEKVSGTWPLDRDTIISSPPSAPDTPQPILFNLATNIVGALNSGAASIRVTITEIEMMDGTIYNPSTEATGFVSTDWGETWAQTALIDPGQAQAGSIHVPWESNLSESLMYYGQADFSVNREFRLVKQDGSTQSDISPSDGTRSYGVNRYGFAIRAYDSNRQYLLLGGIGNDTSADPDDDMHGVWVSDDFGATWTNIVTPEADSNAPAGRPAFEAAFSGTTQNVIYIWGKDSFISFSDDFGVTVDDRSGNLASSFSAEAFIGIAGGPG